MRHDSNPSSRRDGFALPVALLAIMVIGAIVTGGFYASSQESRISTSASLGNQAFYVAEYGLEQAAGTWKNDKLTNVEDTTTLDPVTVSTGGSNMGTYRLSIRRIGAQMFLVTSEGTVAAGPRQATRRVANMLRTSTPNMPYPTALAVFGGVTASGNSEIRGADAGGPGCMAGDTVAGVTAPADSLVDEGERERISGDPAVATDPALDSATLTNYGDLGLDELIAAATHTYSGAEDENGMGPVTTTDADGNTVCDLTVRSNWGDPSDTGPCADHMPIIHAKPDPGDPFELRTGTGQGILIVEGDLHATGNFDFYGVVIVTGTLFTAGTGNHLEGSVIVMGDGQLDSESTSTGDSLVQYSRCRILRSFNASLRPKPLTARSWLDFSAMTRGEAES